MTSASINGLYPVEAFELQGTGKVDTAGPLRFWASRERYSRVHASNHSTYDEDGVATSEFLEINLGRTRQVSYISANLLHSPMDVEIAYATGTDDETRWVNVTPMSGMPFANRQNFDVNKNHPYALSEFYFTDSRGRLIDTNRLRMHFKRRHVAWPKRNSAQFPWSVVVRDLRIGRPVMGQPDLRGNLIDALQNGGSVSEQDILDTPDASGTATVTQRFMVPTTAYRGAYLPDLTGFSVLMYAAEDDYKSAVISWILRDETADKNIESGSAVFSNQDPASGDAWNTDAIWLDIPLRIRRAVDTTSVYSLTVHNSRDATKCYRIGLATPNRLSSRPLVGTYVFSNGSATITFAGASRDSLLTGGAFIRNSDEAEATPGLIDDVAFNAITNTGTITLSQPWGGSSASAATAEVVFPVDVTPATFRTDPVFSVTNASQTVTYASTTNLNSLFTSGDQIRLAGSANDFQTIAGVSYDSGAHTGTLTLAHPYADATFASIRLEGRSPLAIDAYSSLCLRVWGNCADEGQDVLGNSYRSVAVFDHAQSVIDGSGRGWISEPQPSPNAVECLYFDVSQKNSDNLGTAIDAIRVTPITNGVLMNVYVSNELPFDSTDPVFDRSAYDRMVWTPSGSFSLNGEVTVPLKRREVAKYVKLEFTNLRPLPFSFSSVTSLPAKTYHRYPTWLEQLYSDPLYGAYRRVVEDWFVENYASDERVHTTKIALLGGRPDWRGTISDFNFENRLFLMDLMAASKRKAISRLVAKDHASDVIDVAGLALVDPTTKSKIRLFSNRSFTQPLWATIDPTSLLGESVSATVTPNVRSSPVETIVDPPRTNFVSTPDPNRVSVSYATLTATSMAWDRPCVHAYKLEKSKFNGKAYFAGVQRVQLLTSRHAVAHDEAVIEGTPLALTDRADAIESTYGTAYYTKTAIPDQVYVSYVAPDEDVIDEAVTLSAFESVALSVVGTAESITVRDKISTDPSATTFKRGTDFKVGFVYSPDGEITTTVARAALPQRVLFSTGDAIEFYDAATVPIRFTISGQESS